MSTPQRIVIIGGGLAGAKTVEALREQEYEGHLTLIGEESHLPYERPPLSKEYLAGSARFEDSIVHTGEWFRQHRVDLHLGSRAIAIDRDSRKVSLDSGDHVTYDELVLATGATPRRSDLPGAEAEGVHYLRTPEDSDVIRESLGAGRRLVIIGGGWIGLEVAANARAAGAEVTLVERSRIPLARTLGDQMGQVFLDRHREEGVDVLTETEVSEIMTEGGRVSGLRLVGGRELPADLVVIGLGAIPNVELAEAAGLDLAQGGVAVDAALTTSDPHIYAVGDVAAHQHPVLGRRLRVEHWANALNQPKALAPTLLGERTEYAELPYFFSDQYDLGMEYLGSVPGEHVNDVVVRGDVSERKFLAFWLDSADAMLAVMAVNVWDMDEQIKPLLGQGRPIDRRKLADPSVPFADL